MVRLTPTRMVSAVALTSFLLFYWIASFFFGPRGFDLMHEIPATTRLRPGPDVVFGEECSPFSGGVMEDVVVVLKMGSSEVPSALPAYINRLGRCRIDLLLFSDRDTEYHGFKVIDALRTLRPEYKYKNPDFEIYDKIQASDASTEKTHEGWRLDKYKFLPMMEITAHMRPDARWFVFLELDTYVNWDNMYRFLSKFNPRNPHYFGSPVWPPKKTVFAHGGSGFVLSRGAMDKLVARGRMFAENYQSPGTHLFGKDVSNMCCGDEVLGQVLKDCGIPIRGYWPMFNGEKPSTVRFEWEQWCEAILTLHHVQEYEHDQLKIWEATRKRPSKPLTFEELFTSVEPHLRDQVDDWSNMSEDVTFKAPHSAAQSFDTCHTACLQDTKCMQFEHFGDTCRLSHAIRLGHPQSPEGETKWISGWVMDRIKAFQDTYSPCKAAHFVHPNP